MRHMAPRVILDTNALLMPFEFPINIDLELKRLLGDCEIVVPGPVIGELRRSQNKFAGAALQLAAKYPIERTQMQGDKAIVELATSSRSYVVTNDRPLRAKLRRLGVPVISLRSGNHLVLEGD